MLRGRPAVEVLAERDGEPVLLREGRILVASFRPEPTDDPRAHERFLNIVVAMSGGRTRRVSGEGGKGEPAVPPEEGGGSRGNHGFPRAYVGA
jgi:hypothetical protein